MIAVSAALWAAAVVAAALVVPPPPARVAALRPRRRGRRRAAPRRGAVVVLAGGAALVLWPPAVVAVAGVALLAPRVGRVQSQRRARQAVVEGLPDTVDLIALATSAGLTVPLVVGAVAERAPPPFGPAFAAVDGRAHHGVRLADALATLPDELGEGVRPLASALVAAERYGVALGPTLEHLAYDARRERRRRAEIAARKLPVRLCFPLVGCILPAFALLTIVPLLAGALWSLQV